MWGCNHASTAFLYFRLMVVAFIATSYGFGATPAHDPESKGAHYEFRSGKLNLKFDPARAEDLNTLARAARMASEGEGPTLAHDERKLRRGLKEVQRLVEDVLRSPSENQRARATTLLLETVAAINNNQRPPVPSRLDFVQVPFVFVEHMHRPVGRGHRPANDLEDPDEPMAGGDGDTRSHDLSQLDPAPSTFWSRPADIEDLYHGFGRTNLYQLDGKLCTYSKAKDSYGSNPGFEVSRDGAEFKIKFGEVSSEPFTARMFAALGFHADPTDYVSGIALRYDRRIFQEFHSRQPLKTRFTLFGVLPLYVQDLQKRYDPFTYIAWAELRDGTRWTGRELRARLLRHSIRAHPEDDRANFRPEIEEQIARLVTVPANVQMKDTKSIGPWDFGQLDHAGRRELRGAGLLAAWLGWFDTRFDNTRLRVVRRGTEVELRHYFSDLGGGLGNTSGFLYWRGERPNEFPWEFTRASFAPDSTPRSFQIVGYKPMAYTAAFAEMTIDDARWMARLIGQLREKQIVEALVGSGYGAAEVRLYEEKLISRRDRMIVDLGLAGEIPLLRPQGVNRHFSYDPRVEGQVSVEVRGAGVVKALMGDRRILDGKLVGTER